MKVMGVRANVDPKVAIVPIQKIFTMTILVETPRNFDSITDPSIIIQLV